MEINEQIKYPKEGVVTILQEKPDYSGFDVILPPVKNQILDYGRSIFPWLLTNEGNDFKLGYVLYGDGRPIGNDETFGSGTGQTPWPTNNIATTGTYPKFENTNSPNTKLSNIDALEPDLFNKINFYDTSTNTETNESDVKYLRFRQSLHNQLLFNTAFGDPRPAIFNKFSNNIKDSTNVIPAFNELITEQNTNNVDLASTYPKQSFEWKATFVSTLPRNCKASIGGSDVNSFVFNEIMLAFNPNVSDDDVSDTQSHSGIAMRYLPNITKVDGLSIIIYWTLIF